MGVAFRRFELCISHVQVYIYIYHIQEAECDMLTKESGIDMLRVYTGIDRGFRKDGGLAQGPYGNLRVRGYQARELPHPSGMGGASSAPKPTLFLTAVGVDAIAAMGLRGIFA